MTTDLYTGRPMKQIVLFSLPIMLSSLLQYTYNMVDNIIVGALCVYKRAGRRW